MITTENNKERYVGTGSADTFAYNFKINDASHLEVKMANTDDTEAETLVLDTDYTVTGVGAADGNVILSAGNLATGKILSIRRVVPFTQGVDFNNQGGFFPEDHENAIDYAMMAVQQLKEEVDRCPKVSETSGLEGAALISTITDAKDACVAAQVVCEAAQAAVGDVVNYVNDIVLHSFEATATAGQTYVDVTGFSLASSLDNVECFIDGVKQAKSTLTRTSATRLTLGGALVGGELIEIKSASFSPSAGSEAAAAAVAAQTAQGLAETAKTAAQSAQAAAESYVPPLAGNAAKVLTVKADASGTEWKTPAGGVSYTTGTFVNGDLAAGILTITHNKGLSAPYVFNAEFFDNNGKPVFPTPTTPAANSYTFSFSNFGTLSGTWSWRYL